MLASRNASSPKVDVAQGVNPNSISIPQANVPRSFIINITTTSTVATNAYALLFDVAGASAAALSLATSTGVTVSGQGVAYNAIKSLVAYQPVYVQAINYQTDGEHQDLQLIQAEMDGGSIQKPLQTFMAKRNTQEQTNLLTIPVGFWLSSMTAIKVNVTGGQVENIKLGFFIGAQSQRYS